VKNNSNFESATDTMTDLANIERVGNVPNLSNLFLYVPSDAYCQSFWQWRMV